MWAEDWTHKIMKGKEPKKRSNKRDGEVLEMRILWSAMSKVEKMISHSKVRCLLMSDRLSFCQKTLWPKLLHPQCLLAFLSSSGLKTLVSCVRVNEKFFSREDLCELKWNWIVHVCDVNCIHHKHDVSHKFLIKWWLCPFISLPWH